MILLVPAPSIGVVAAMFVWPGQSLGMAIYAVCKLWLLALPIAWHVGIDNGRAGLSPVRRDGLVAGLLIGLATLVIIALAWWLVDPLLGWLEVGRFRQVAVANHLDRPAVYLAGGLYFTTVNALLEEYVWRWFVVSRLTALMPTAAAVLIGSAGFTAHHVLALGAQFDRPITLAASAGIFLGAVCWSWLYARYRSIWPGYLAHVCADAAVFAVGYHLLFSRS